VFCPHGCHVMTLMAVFATFCIMGPPVLAMSRRVGTIVVSFSLPEGASASIVIALNK